MIAAAADPEPTAGTEIPDVHFAVFRFDYTADSLVAVYEFSQPYYKSLPPPGYRESVNLHWDFEWPSDFGWTDVESRLTGERILRATSVWMGYGDFEYPPDSLKSTTLEHGYTNPAPDSLISPGIIYPTDVAYAWGLVYDTDVIGRLSSHGLYEVYAWVHNYADGGYGPLYELFIVAATRPVGPDDMAILDVDWPRSLVTRGVAVVPEVRIHNFGDSPGNVAVTAAVTGDPGQPYVSIRNQSPVLPDETRVVTMHPYTAYGSGDLQFDYRFLGPDHATWSDTYPENDVLQVTVAVTDQPVFRFDATVPVDGIPFDFDGDGDVDICEFDYELELWQNDGTGVFTDISSCVEIGNRRSPMYAVCDDFNGDTYPDILVTYFEESPQLLVGDGTGCFADSTLASGLDAVTSYEEVLALDKENDGDIDAIFQSPGQETVVENNGSGFFTIVTATSGIVDNSRTSALSSGDLNGDDYTDVVLSNWQSDAAVFINDGDGTFTRLARSWNAGWGADAAVLDFDDDGDEDLLLVQSSYGPSRFYRNNGSLVFEEITTQLGGIPGGAAVDVGDFNHDGRPDMVFTGGSLLMNTGGAFADTSALLIDRAADNRSLGIDVHFADINNNGDPDVYGNYAVYINQGMRASPIGVDGAGVARRGGYLEQNFPNPFNPSTSIRYRIETPGRVTLVIYNVAGQRVKTLVDEVQILLAAGRIARWDGRNEGGERVASGVYFYQLTAPAINETKKLVLLK
jgi:hypothetical protein